MQVTFRRNTKILKLEASFEWCALKDSYFERLVASICEVISCDFGPHFKYSG